MQQPAAFLFLLLLPLLHAIAARSAESSASSSSSSLSLSSAFAPLPCDLEPEKTRVPTTYEVGVLLRAETWLSQQISAAVCFALEDTECDKMPHPLHFHTYFYNEISSLAIAKALELCDSGALGIIGPYYSSEVQSVQHALTRPLVEVGITATSSALSDKALYPTFLRVTPSDSLQVQAMVALLRHSNVTAVATLTISDYYGLYGANDFVNAASGSGILTLAQEIYSSAMTEPTDAALASQFNALENSGVKTFVMFCLPETCYIVLKYALSRGLLDPPYMWLLSDGATATSREDVERFGAGEVLYHIANTRTVITVFSDPGKGPGYSNFSSRMEPYLVSGATGADTIASYAYDATYAFVQGAKNLFERNEDPYNLTLLHQEMLGLKITGMSGPISFDANGDRTIPFAFFTWINGSSAPIRIGSWNTTTIEIDPRFSFWSRDYVCGNGKIDWVNEQCDSGTGCLPNCTCAKGYEQTTPLTADCKPVGMSLTEIVIIAIVAGGVLITAIVAGSILFVLERQRSRKNAAQNAMEAAAAAAVGVDIDVIRAAVTPVSSQRANPNTVEIILDREGADTFSSADSDVFVPPPPESPPPSQFTTMIDDTTFMPKLQPPPPPPPPPPPSSPPKEPTRSSRSHSHHRHHHQHQNTPSSGIALPPPVLPKPVAPTACSADGSDVPPPLQL